MGVSRGDGEVELWSAPAARVSAVEREVLVLTDGERFRTSSKGSLTITNQRLLFDGDGRQWKHVRAVYLQQAGRRLYLLAVEHGWSAARYRLRTSEMAEVSRALTRVLGERAGSGSWHNDAFEDPAPHASDR